MITMMKDIILKSLGGMVMVKAETDEAKTFLADQFDEDKVVLEDSDIDILIEAFKAKGLTVNYG